MTRARAYAAAALVSCLAACGGSARAPRRPTARPESTFGAPDLVAMVPPEAEWVLELDLARVRANAAVGNTVLTFAEATDGRARAALGLNPLLDADHAVIASFPGTEGPAILFLFRGEKITAAPARPDAVAIDAHTVAIGPEGPRQAARAAAAGKRASIFDDADFNDLRDAVIPSGAPGASVRLTARLPFGRRIAVASQLDLDEAPARLSVWGDVADDLVIIMRADAERPDAARRLAESSEKKLAEVVRVILPGGRVQVKPERTLVRVIVEVGPRALAELARTFVPAGPGIPIDLGPRR